MASLLLLLSLHVFAQTFPVTVKVISLAGGDPPGGVTVQVKNGRATTTKVDGTFQINTPSATSTLVFRYVGYAEQEVAISNRNDITVTLVPASTALESIVAVGNGTRRTGEVTGAITS